MRRFPVLVLAALGLTLVACGDDGGGGGDEDAFCDSMETLADQVADGDLATDNGLEDVVDTMNDLIETASDDDVETVQDAAESIAEADPDDADDTADDLLDDLGDIAEDECDVEIEAPTTTTTETTEPGSTTTTDETPSTDDTSTTQGGGSDDIVVHARQPVPGDIAAEFADLANACFEGDMASCDELFATTPVDSVDEDYGETCGGRLEEAQPGQCAALITAPVDVPPDVVDQATASACQGGDMVACDDLFRNAEENSVDQAYGALCAGRVQNTDAFCVDIFGDVAFL